MMNTLQQMNERFSQTAGVGPVAPQVPDPQFDRDKFFEDPGSAISKLIEVQLNRQVGPINNQILAFTRSQTLNALLQQASTHPQLSANWNKIEPLVRGDLTPLLQRQDVGPNEVQASVFRALGALAIGGQLNNSNDPNSQQNNNVPQNNNANVMPSTVRPSVSPLPNQQPEKPRIRQLTENEVTLAGRQKMNNLQWLYHGGEISFDTAKAHDPNFKP